MSPRRTFHSCGSSSRLVRRRKRPTRVTRGSWRSLNIGSLSSSGEITSSDARLCVVAHGAELVDAERAAVATGTQLAEERRPTRVEPDGERDDQHQRREEDQQERRHDHVEQPLDRHRRPRDALGAVLDHGHLGHMAQLYRGPEHRPHRGQDAELDALQPAGGGDLGERCLVELRARRASSARCAPRRVASGCRPCSGLGATPRQRSTARRPSAALPLRSVRGPRFFDRQVVPRLERELARDRVRELTAAHHQRALGWHASAPETARARPEAKADARVVK